MSSEVFPTSLSQPFDETPNNTSDNSKLATMLRECANYVERNQFHPIIYGALGALHAYAGEKSGTPTSNNEGVAANGVQGRRFSNGGIKPERKTSRHNSFSGDAVTPPIPTPTTRSASRPRPEKDNPPSSTNKIPTPKESSSTHGIHVNLNSFGSLGKKVWGGISNTSTSKLKDDRKAENEEWCDEHFIMGCGCKQKKESSSASVETTFTAPPPEMEEKSDTSKKAKPCFQRPINASSNLIANGWIEQQRRSKMRIVWKDVLASLVEGRKHGEETTLWVQRQVTGPSGNLELEALHQIPMKWVEDISYLDFYGDHRFAIKVYNFNDEFHFRCGDESSAMNWVATLRGARETSMKKDSTVQPPVQPPVQQPVQQPQQSSGSVGSYNLDDYERNLSPNASNVSDGSQSQLDGANAGLKKRLTIKELRAIAQNAGVDTRGMERSDLEKIAAKYGHLTPPAATAPPTPDSKKSMKQKAEEKLHKLQEFQKAKQMADQLEKENKRLDQEKKEVEQRRKMKEMEEENRRRVAEEIEKRKSEEARKRMEEEQRKRVEEERRRIEEEQRRSAQQEAVRRRAEQLAEEQRKKVQEELERRKKQDELERKRKQEEMDRKKAEELAAEERRKADLAAAEERRRQQELEERRRQQEMEARIRQQELAAIEERKRREAEEQFKRQQEAAAKEAAMRRQQDQAAAEQFRRQQEQAAADQRRRQQEQEEFRRRQEEQRKRQQFQQQSWQQQNFSQQQYPQGFYSQQQSSQQQPFFNNSAPPPPPPPPQPNTHPKSPVNTKYAKAMSEGAEQAAITAIKRNILISWALHPPMLQTLRPIDQLVTTIHRVFPPAFGVPGHEYFSKWKPISSDELAISAVMSNTPDEDKVKKAVRKIRFFLHPDKLPRDLNSEQEFMCKMLWDVTSDAWEEFCTRNEELDWVK